MTKYVVHPGVAPAPDQSAWRFIGFDELCRLYGVDPGACIDARRVPAHLRDGDHLVNLFPLGNGRYSLPAPIGTEV